MRGVTVVCLLELSRVLSVQSSSSPVCKWLTPDEARAVIGEGASLQTALDNGACIYVNGRARLQIAQPARLDDPRALRMGYESMKQSRNGEDEPGIGDAAFVAASRREVAFLKGNAVVVITVDGDGVEDRLPALREAVRKIAERF